MRARVQWSVHLSALLSAPSEHALHRLCSRNSCELGQGKSRQVKRAGRTERRALASGSSRWLGGAGPGAGPALAKAPRSPRGGGGKGGSKEIESTASFLLVASISSLRSFLFSQQRALPDAPPALASSGGASSERELLSPASQPLTALAFHPPPPPWS